ncbi:Neuronal acetylcholine receptor subunit alpha-5 [Mizuhopecten yessoensis]|uniref:Neuronal acetylcholine receptor subunit alpha-5 n=1 Tax=Mizuhopecten yessoensis TaxID=6573 RepID=A0A210QIP1_MIZYE|nr:Neuronal acetylcholine receptor subunit alpha-5 [Mizuhopecten yessoensis]
MELYIIVLSVLFVGVHAGSYNNMAKLHTDLLSDYSRNIRPIENQNNQMSITFIHSLSNFQSFDAVTGRLTCLLTIYLAWTDEKLRWTPANYGNVEKAYFAKSQVWTPDVVLASGVDSLSFTVTTSVTVTNYGYASAIAADVVTSICTPDITYYPYDVHNCSLLFIASDPYTLVDLTLFSRS